jgi:YesN/AraC family two-component response regulator
VNAVKLGAVDYLSKPVDADDVVAALLALDGRKAEPPENPMSADRVRWEHIPAHLRALWTQCFGDRPPAQHAPSHAATHPGQARAEVGSLYRHLPAVVLPEGWRKNSISQCNQNRIRALLVRIGRRFEHVSQSGRHFRTAGNHEEVRSPI